MLNTSLMIILLFMIEKNKDNVKKSLNMIISEKDLDCFCQLWYPLCQGLSNYVERGGLRGVEVNRGCPQSGRAGKNSHPHRA